jgi:ribosomal protein S18 acetylase RimI-like enzyme
MHDSIRVTPAAVVDGEFVEAMQRLIPQLSSSAEIPDHATLAGILASPCTTLLLARDRTQENRIVGSLTLAVFRIPTGVRAWIEDVVVDVPARGQGVGAALSREALRIARSLGAGTVELTSRPSREAANRLYRRLGFQRRQTNVYRYALRDDEHAG